MQRPVDGIDQFAEQPCRHVRVVGRGVGLFCGVVDAGPRTRFAKHCVPVGHRRQADGIHHGKRMKGAALDAVAHRRGVNEAVVEVGVVRRQDGALTALALDFLAHQPEQLADRDVLRHAISSRMVQVDAGDFQGGRLDFRVRVGDHLPAMTAGHDQAVGLELEGQGGNFQQRVGGGVETAGLQIQHHRQIAAKARSHVHRRSLTAFSLNSRAYKQSPQQGSPNP